MLAVEVAAAMAMVMVMVGTCLGAVCGVALCLVGDVMTFLPAISCQLSGRRAAGAQAARAARTVENVAGTPAVEPH